ncbi:MAG: HlyD family secretion protein [Idiomarinaceae bacterium HL-53]|nr:MAG: HlyD family secretion protein [Idiomarinaceae bacterium HL-53]
MKELIRCGLVFTLPFSILVLSACSDSSADESEQQSAPTPRVLVVTAEAANLSLERSFTARTEGSMEAEVKARASGQLVSREFTEGQLVEANSVMFRIEKAPYEVTLQ